MDPTRRPDPTRRRDAKSSTLHNRKIEISSYVAGGLDGFGRFWDVLDVILGRGGRFGPDLHVRSWRLGRVWPVLDVLEVILGRGGRFGPDLHV